MELRIAVFVAWGENRRSIEGACEKTKMRQKCTQQPVGRSTKQKSAGGEKRRTR